MNKREISTIGLTLKLSFATCGIVCFVCLIVFLILKLTGAIDWYWHWIFFPLFLFVVIGLLLVIIAFISVAIFDR